MTAVAGSSNRPYMLNAERLPPEQRLLASTIVRWTGSSGVLVGAYIGPQSWDLRPLVLEYGILMQIRTSDPALARNQREALRELHRRVRTTAIDSLGEEGEQLWTKRRFFSTMLADRVAFSPQNLSSRRAFEIKFWDHLLTQLLEDHSRGIFHGHIVTHNLALVDSSPLLVDYGWTAFDPTSPLLVEAAPELQGGGALGASTDVFGLGRTWLELGDAQIPAEVAVLAREMCAPDPILRPSLIDVAARFRSSFQAALLTPHTGTPSGQSGYSGALPIGRLVNRTEVDVTAQTQVVSAAEILAEQATNSLPVVQAESGSKVFADRLLGGRQKTNPVVLAIGIAGVLAGLLLAIGGQSAITSIAQMLPSWRTDAVPYVVDWASNNPGLMEQVARAAAVDAVPEAIEAIVDDARRGVQRGRDVRNRLLRVGFDDLWQEDLSTADRKVLLRQALAEFVPTNGLPDLNRYHPAVALAIASDSDPVLPYPQLSVVSMEMMSTLAPPFGPAFGELSKLGVRDLSDTTARSLAQLITGTVDEHAVAQFLESKDNQTALFKLRILLPLMAQTPKLDVLTFAVLRRQNKFFADAMQWFADNDLPGWEGVISREKLFILAGVPPVVSLNFEQYGDLLRYPVESIRNDAADHIRKIVPGRFDAVLDYLATAENRLSRYQTIALLAALQVKGETGVGYLTAWFRTDPPAEAVVSLLLAQPESEEVEPFTIESVRFLKSREWSVTLRQLDQMARHKEPLVRALAYARLDPQDPSQLALLIDASKREENARIREQLIKKLADSR